MTPTPLLVVLSGPSGAGKDAILDELARRGHPFHRAVTCTTRPPREGERDGLDYHFVSDAGFDRLIAEDGLLEHALVYNHRYGVPRAPVAEALRAGADVYVRTDVQGAATIKRLAPGAVLVFVAPASLDELEARLRARGPADERDIARRLQTAREEMSRAPAFDHTLPNPPGALDETVARIEEILDQERRTPHDLTALL